MRTTPTERTRLGCLRPSEMRKRRATKYAGVHVCVSRVFHSPAVGWFVVVVVVVVHCLTSLLSSRLFYLPNILFFIYPEKKKKPIDEEPLLEVVDGETRFDAVQEPVIRAVRIRAMQRGFARI